MDMNQSATWYHSPEALTAIVEKFKWPYENSMQDWPLEISDQIDLAFCLEEYPKLTATDEKFLLMRGILYALDEYKADDIDKYVQKTAGFLRADFDIHKATVYYWTLYGTQIRDGFNITPFMRTVWDSQI